MRWFVVVLGGVVSACGAPKQVSAPPAGESAPHPFTDEPAADWSSPEREAEMDITIPPFDPTHGAGTADQLIARYRGKDRGGAKTSISNAKLEQMASVAELQAALPTDDEMLHHDPTIERDSDTRYPEEDRHVAVHAWIYAVKYEADQDWHVILGTDPKKKPIHYFNAEISGLPAKTAPAYRRLAAVRKAFSKVLDNNPPASDAYRKYTPPIAVDVEGSTFYDIDHPPGAVGPKDSKPTTAWEIHPVTHIAPRS
jgi:hypothetical protein